ncbi:MAG TPA: pyridoxal-phosphate dependent enzyme, partial [Terriglobales bacterium]|nr:pyridoxal-phosphate dependent enzyme [Terriglobales bacterium]
EGQIAWGKLSQSLDYGALTCQLRTDFDGCMRVLNQLVIARPIYVLNSVNPYRLEGQKTAAVELLEQLNWEVPDHVVVPGGNLGNSSALGKAFLEMQELGLISRLPRLSIIQAEGANPFFRCIREHGGKKLVPVQAETMATAIRIGNPASWKKARRVLESTQGAVEQVSEAEIAIAKAEIGADGIGCEPASAVTLAGLKKLVKQGFIRRQETVILILTGHLLKDPEFTLKFHRGDLLAQQQSEFAALKTQRRPPLALDADVNSVLKILDQAESSDRKT